MYYGRVFMKVLRLESTKTDYNFTNEEEEKEEEEETIAVQTPIKKIKARLKRRGSTEEMMNFVSSPVSSSSSSSSSSEEEESSDEENTYGGMTDEEQEDHDDGLLNGGTSSSTQNGGMASLNDLQHAFKHMDIPNMGVVNNASGQKEQSSAEQIRGIKHTLLQKAKESDEVIDARSRNQAKLDTWANNTGGQLKNIRALLSTMHTVLYEGARWKEVGMSDLLTARDIQKHFLKAMRVVHTDKLPKGATPEMIAVAEIIYNALIKAKKTFDTTEGGTRR